MQTEFKNLLLDGKAVDIAVEDGVIKSIAPHAGDSDPGCAPRPVAPAFYNGHTHLAMNLLREFADDL
jgi:cytosine/adenosine deaminase-related metal-dependent hydrolase